MKEYMELTDKQAFEPNRKVEIGSGVTPAGFGLIRDRTLLDVNPVLCGMVGYTLEELNGQSDSILYPSQEDYGWLSELSHETFCEYGAIAVETQWIKKDSTVIDVFLSLNPIDRYDLAKGMTFIAVDITQRKENEKQLQAQLEEKVILLKEVHHRIKNNVSVIKSLLSLQMRDANDDSVRETLKMASERLSSMMILYDKIYRRESRLKDDIFLDDYLSSLVDEIISTYPVDVKIEKDISNRAISSQTAFYMGIIVYELLSNAIKYGLPDSKEKVISISTQADDACIRVFVKDNGKGFVPSHIKKGFGLQLVETLSEQLNGRFSIENNNGTCCSLQFDL
mgnify:CR=1 FL=1